MLVVGGWKPRHRRFFASLIATAGTLLAGFPGAGMARGEDLVTLSGATYHDARPLFLPADLPDEELL